jgi:hypothetical protein
MQLMLCCVVLVQSYVYALAGDAGMKYPTHCLCYLAIFIGSLRSCSAKAYLESICFDVDKHTIMEVTYCMHGRHGTHYHKGMMTYSMIDAASRQRLDSRLDTVECIFVSQDPPQLRQPPLSKTPKTSRTHKNATVNIRLPVRTRPHAATKAAAGWQPRLRAWTQRGSLAAHPR